MESVDEVLIKRYKTKLYKWIRTAKKIINVLFFIWTKGHYYFFFFKKKRLRKCVKQPKVVSLEDCVLEKQRVKNILLYYNTTAHATIVEKT